MKTKYVKNLTQLADIFGITRDEINRKWVNKIGWPPKTEHGWDVEACYTFWKEDKRKTVETTAGVNCDIKRRKLIAEAKLKEIEVEEKMGKIISHEKYLEHGNRMAEVYKSAFLEFTQWFIALHPDPENIKKLEELQNRARARIREVISGLSE